MKKINSLALSVIVISLIGFSQLNAQMKCGAGKCGAAMKAPMSKHNGMNKFAMNHANPMPNLMRVALGNADLLGLSEKQKSALMSWKNANQPKLRGLVKEVMSGEKALKEQALTNDNDTMKKANEILELRRQIMQTKTNCRESLKQILSKDQYGKVVSIYKSMN